MSTPNKIDAEITYVRRFLVDFARPFTIDDLIDAIESDDTELSERQTRVLKMLRRLARSYAVASLEGVLMTIEEFKAFTPIWPGMWDDSPESWTEQAALTDAFDNSQAR